MNRILMLVLLFVVTQVVSAWMVAAAPSDLDPTWGNGGIVVEPLGWRVQDLHTQADGKIVVYGSATSGSFIARFNQNGTLDASFGTNGRVFIQHGGSSGHSAFQSDGKIVVVFGGFPSVNYTLVRYNTNGTLDTTFGTNGTVVTPISFYDRINDLIVQPDGKIIAAGETVISNNYAFLIARHNSNGSLDTAFGTNGKAIIDVTGVDDIVSTVHLQPDGKIVLGGFVGIKDVSGDFLLARLLTNGALDLTFGSGGIVITALSGYADYLEDLALQADGKIIAVGNGGFDDTKTNYEHAALVRYNIDGTLDGSFATNGILRLFLRDNNYLSFNAVTVQSNGKILTVGSRGGGFAVARFNTNGSFDSSFGTKGIVNTQFGNNNFGLAYEIALQPDGKIIAAGTVYNNIPNSSSIAIVRYLGDSNQQRAKQFDFDGDNKADISVFRPENGTWYRLNSSNNSFVATQFGAANDRIIPADYDGDRRSDHAVFRNGEWFILQSSNNTLRAVSFGQAADAPVPSDYDGDGRADAAVFRSGNWYILQSSTNQLRTVQFGNSTDKPVQADYDGDSKADVAVFRDGNWFYLQSTDNSFRAVQFGQSGDKPVVADYDGDSKADPAVYRNGAWYLLRSTAGFATIQFGAPSDIPTPADYDGDSKTDVSVFRNGMWYRLNSSNNEFVATQFGATNDRPVPAAFVP